MSSSSFSGSSHPVGDAPTCARCHDPELVPGGPLSSLSCPRCGGGLVTEDGMGRLLEELGHTTAELRELASHFAGARLPCPACKSRMSPLLLRGASVDLCFGCGSMWVDKGDLEAVSGGRYQMPAATTPLARATPAVIPSQSLVRIDERTFPRHVGRSVLAGVGAVGVVWWVVGLVPFVSGAAGVIALAAAAGLSRRQAFDVLPRARRMMRWRGFFAPSPHEMDGEPFSGDSCVVVRRLRVQRRELPWVVIDLVDAEGRDLVRLRGPLLPHRAWTEGPRYARALGVSVRFDVDPKADDALDVEEAARADLPTFATESVIRIEPELTTWAEQPRMLSIRSERGAVGAVTTEVAAVVDPAGFEQLFAEHFVLQDSGGQRARLYSTVQLGRRATIVVGPSGAQLGHVTAERGFLADTFTWRGPQARRGVTLRLVHGAVESPLIDTFGREVGLLQAAEGLPKEPRPVTLRLVDGRCTGNARWGLLALALHASLAAAVDDL